MTWHLIRQKGEACIQLEDDIIPIKVMWAKPFSGRNKDISFVSKKGVAIAHIDSISDLEPEEQKIAKEELDNRYFIAEIVTIYHIEAIFGSYYWHVNTNKGERKFILRNVNRNFTFMDKDYLVIHDHAGNYYEVPDIQKLNVPSLKQLRKITT